MKAIRGILAAAALSIMSTAALAQASGGEGACLAPDYSKSGRMTWFLGIHPTDDLLTVWCRLQDLPGAVRFNILFPETGAHRSWETSFDGPTLPAQKIIEIVQSLLPTTDGPAKDSEGMEFPKVLGKVVQLAAAETENGTPLNFASDHPAAKELVLWEPVVLRVKPVALAGQEFTLTIILKPNLGLLSLGLQGMATDIKLQGWKGRLPTGGMFGSECSSLMPLCKEVSEVATFHAPWLVDEVRLQATGENMTAAAMTIMQRLASGHHSSRDRSGPSMNEKSGRGSLTLKDDLSVMEMRADGNGGTKSITIVWKEAGGTHSIKRRLEEAGKLYRAGTANTNKEPNVPDSLGRL